MSLLETEMMKRWEGCGSVKIFQNQFWKCDERLFYAHGLQRSRLLYVPIITLMYLPLLSFFPRTSVRTKCCFESTEEFAMLILFCLRCAYCSIIELWGCYTIQQSNIFTLQKTEGVRRYVYAENLNFLSLFFLERNVQLPYFCSSMTKYSIGDSFIAADRGKGVAKESLSCRRRLQKAVRVSLWHWNWNWGYYNLGFVIPIL